MWTYISVIFPVHHSRLDLQLAHTILIPWLFNSTFGSTALETRHFISEIIFISIAAAKNKLFTLHGHQVESKALQIGPAAARLRLHSANFRHFFDFPACFLAILQVLKIVIISTTASIIELLARLGVSVIVIVG